ncbi:hypothetical protein CMO88_00115 [Candidatus Woesearchaeota archaeon]|nr:hypothetical protein [Candidatus Woesearchaeota archaeon]|tara:strand:- start:6806 stop:7114 length:309 start_codon:yes stop_codon:yes gene_type:complete
MRASYKQKCIVCRKNHALVTWKNRVPVCVECKMREINKPIKDKKFKKMFDIDNALYEKSGFLRNIKSSYLRFGELSEKQIEMFKKVVEEVKKKKDKTSDNEI